MMMMIMLLRWPSKERSVGQSDGRYKAYYYISRYRAGRACKRLMSTRGETEPGRAAGSGRGSRGVKRDGYLGACSCCCM